MTPRPIHMVGVGGAGMSALAKLATEVGYRVSGTDRDDSPLLDALRAMGIAASAGHRAEALPADAEALVVSSAIADDNPELVAARARDLPVLHRSELLAELMGLRRGLAVSGAHGKSTTTAMLALALGGSAICVGAALPGGDGTGAEWGAGEWFAVEADESDRSLLRLAPEAAILLNVDHDHHATYASLAEVQEVMRAFVAALPAAGVLVVGPDDAARACAEAAPCPIRLVGDLPGAWCAVEGAGQQATLVLAAGERVAMPLLVPGEHNAQNAACAVALADWCGVPAPLAASRLGGFAGVGRRFEEQGTVGGVRVVDDYAHHPAEVAATLRAARALTRGRLVAVFQPHLFSRTQALASEFGEALGAADLVIVTDIYPAREAPIPGVTGQSVAELVGGGAETYYVPALDDVAIQLAPRLRSGDLVLTLGAGTITRLGQELLSQMKKVGGNDRLPGGTPDASFEPTL